MDPQSLWSALDSLCTDVSMVSARLALFVSLLDEYHNDIDASAVPGLSSVLEREKGETERIAEEIKSILRTMSKGR